MKRIFLLSVIFILLSISGYSQSKQELIKELFRVMQQDSIMDKSISAMMPAMLKQMQSEVKDSVQLARSQEIMKATMNAVKEVVRRMTNEDMVLIYDKYFTEENIRDITAFYKSPSGQKFIRTQPEIQKELMPIMFQKYMPEIQKAAKDKIEELKAKESK